MTDYSSLRRKIIGRIVFAFLTPPFIAVLTAFFAGFIQWPDAIAVLSSPVAVLQLALMTGIALILGMVLVSVLQKSREHEKHQTAAISALKGFIPLFLLISLIHLLTGGMVFIHAAGIESQLMGTAIRIILLAQIGLISLPAGAMIDTILIPYATHLPLDRKSFSVPLKAKLALIISFVSVSAYLYPMGLRIGDQAMAGIEMGVFDLLGSNIVPLVNLVLGLALSLSVLNSAITKPIIALTQRIHVAKNHDYRMADNPIFRDELGLAENEFNELMRTISDNMSSSKVFLHELENSSHSLTSMVNEITASVVQITASIQSIDHQMTDQSAHVTETSAAVEQIAKNVESLSANIDLQVENVSESSTAVEEMIANISSISKISSDAKDLSNDLETTSRNGLDQISDLRQTMDRIAANSESLQEANKLISDVAGQTNLLAMNAAIEAAHAGDSGRGFSVVADEIRKLAETSAEQSKTISNNLKAEADSVNTGVLQTESAEHALVDISAAGKKVLSIVDSIETALHEQSSGSKVILQSLNSVDEISTQVRSGAAEMKSGAGEIVTSIRSLSDISERITLSTGEMSEALKEIQQAMQDIQEQANSNNEEVQILSREYDKYTLS
ncbi:methyl-accepting chemotaxis protein [Salinispira pacifica]|uniref:Methyl-accepting chemotaxis protein n=1 Tax=Salinispira pacifica TaxID=1307761 RepID=V5WLC0_9SPIO|nr:methyl-accepting chemotaxis protein [Salinispira pacifica]AHC16455.1 methyl-accepting chemotaxis protein [Salinispira pacifica]